MEAPFGLECDVVGKEEDEDCFDCFDFFECFDCFDGFEADVMLF